MPQLLERYQHHEQHFVDLSPKPVELRQALGRLVCTDDRGMGGVRFAAQLASGAHGLRTDLDTAMGIQGRGERVDDRMDLDIIADITGATTHEGCAAEGLAAPIDRFMADPNNAEYLLEGANQLAPGLVTERDIEMAQARAAVRINEDYFGEDFVFGQDDPTDDYKDVVRLPLDRRDHIGTVMISNDVPGTVYDTARAYDRGAPAYGLTLHHLGNVAASLSHAYPLDNDSLIKASVIRSAVVAAHLPNPDKGEGGKGIDLVYRGRTLPEVV